VRDARGSDGERTSGGVAGVARRDAWRARGLLRDTKAETLDALRAWLAPRGAVDVPSLVHFSLDDWRRGRERVLRHVLRNIGGERLAVRSSARDEDQASGSLAGHYRSHLDVARDPGAIAAAIDDVIASYDERDGHRVLVQEMARGVAVCGVLATRDPTGGGPYTVLEYETGATADAITRGTGTPRRIVVHRSVPLAALDDARTRRLVALARRLERQTRRRALEIELAERHDGTLAVLQLRALAQPARRATLDADVSRVLAHAAAAVEDCAAPRPGVVGSGTILGQMPDWNPAELIGTMPSPLAAALFQDLIADDVWQRARASMGYRALPATRLVTIIAGRPWVDVRASCNSFLPATLDDAPAAALVDGWLEGLRQRPDLHDKLELDVVATVRDFTFAERLRAIQDLTRRGRARWAGALAELTSRNVSIAPGSSLRSALATVEGLGRCALRPPCEHRMDVPHEPRRRALALLDDCRARGTLPFAVIARHAFMAEALLRSAVSRGALRPERLDALRASRRTVTTRLTDDVAAMRAGRLSQHEFLRRYGHLRPGSFDVTAARYDARPTLLDLAPPVARPGDGASRRFALTRAEERALDLLAREAGLCIDGAGIVAHANAAITGRERAKLLFTRHLSAALEHLAAWADRHGLTRDDLARLSLSDIRAAGERVDPVVLAALHERITARRAEERVLRAVRLGSLLRDARDLYLLPDEAHAPTFVTARSATGRPLVLDGRSQHSEPPDARIVCIESADPGYDWVFAHPIAGLVTRFGGGNSHMAIRCFEHRVPAAIGVGEILFDRLRSAALVELRCHEHVVRCLGPAASA
jgi:hypothetical protein